MCYNKYAEGSEERSKAGRIEKMKKYEVSLVAIGSLNAYYGGSNEYEADWVEVIAENEDEAKAKATKMGWTAVRAVDIEAREAKWRAYEEAEAAKERKRQAAAAKRKESEAEKAAALGMDIIEYRLMKMRERRIAAFEREIKRYEKRIAEYREMIEGELIELEKAKG